MGMDLSGFAPRSPKGEYFAANIFAWHPIATYIEAKGPQHIVRKCAYWHSNDNDGLDDEDARVLATWLRARIADGSAFAYLLSPSPLDASVHKIVRDLGLPPGLGLQPTEAEQVLMQLGRFADFLADCGGFSID
jgi:hypothetical protein